MKRHFLAGSAALLAACVGAQEVQQVVVGASRADTRERDTVTAIVINHDDIVRQGDSTLADVLKRQPGITIDSGAGKGPAIRMRGMGEGYVSILLNGLPAPAGFSLESMAPELIERIEILRAGSAELSSQAIAGTINVVLRKAGARAQTEVTAGSGINNGHLSPSVNVQHADRSGALAWSVTANARRNVIDTPTTAVDTGTSPTIARSTATLDSVTDDAIGITPRATWQASPDDTITTSALLRARHQQTTKRDNETTFAGLPSAFPQAHSLYDAHPMNAVADLSWNRRFADSARLELKLAGYYTTRRANFVYDGADQNGVHAGRHTVDSGPTESDVSINGSYRRPLGASHAIAIGWEAGSKERSEYRREHQYDGAGMQTLFTDEQFDASVRRIALFVQDEWEITPTWSLYAGLRGEALHTVGEGNAHAAVDVHAGVWSPLAQALWKRPAVDGSGTRDQFRLALGRSYKAPQIMQLMPRRYTVDNGNSPGNPDQQGNPRLRPELAWNLDAAWERYFGAVGMVGASAYAKRIRDITLDRLYQDNGTWITLPDNQGTATLHGVEVEAKLPWHGATLRANATRNWSRIDAVPGPDNRLDGQAPISATAGIDSATAGALSGGGSFTYRSSITARTSALLRFDSGTRRQLDLYALYKMDTHNRWRASLTNALHTPLFDRAHYADDVTALDRAVTTRTFPTLRLVWEHSL